ncbi:tetratricopeptide repeat protein [Streptomyces sp. S.PB5]|uniref:tetratricopeptide repeat protein n=1 Tax=Streptomyces sp. S.PB5 TaxID=3020844 RepID=UPI0025B094A2|nr:tetratricopeptide repeat protein [Streptomyces sp. S.PB5]MDN3028434.1 tetratricopeptide repeat protein [Streptomyces sp. S.PB5]
MEFDRRVQVRRFPPGRDIPDFGSGYLVGPRLVLTAGHVLGDETGPQPGTVTVSRPDADNRQFPSVVRWYLKNQNADAALIEVDDVQGWEVPESLAETHTRPPQRWGYLIGTRPHPVDIAGFPRMQKSPDDDRRLDEQLIGHIRPGTGSLAGRYEVLSSDPTVPLPEGSPGTPFSGMSGAALLSGDLLCGVVRRDRRATGGTRLIATPAHELLADTAFRTLVAEHTGWEPLLEPAEPASLLAPTAPERDLRSPAMLLRADVEAVGFHSRERERDQLLTWCNDARDAFSVRVLTGPGGQGKTRLARWLSEELRRQSWVTGHLRGDIADVRADRPDLHTLETAHSLFLVVDYADTRPRLVRDLIEQLRTTRHRVRLLLVARADGGWRTDALGATAPTRELLACSPVVELAPLTPRSSEARVHAFTRAATDLARLLKYVPRQPEVDWPALAAALRPPEDLSTSRYDSVLTLQMTALISLLQQGPAPVTAITDQPPEATLLRHERRYWEATADSPEFRLRLRTITLERAIAVAAACGAADQTEADATIRKVPGLPQKKALDTAEWLRALYPPGLHRYWGSLQPDRVAEYLASVVLTGDEMPLSELLDDASTSQQAQIITVLGRAATAHHSAQRSSDSHRVLEALETALDTVSLDPEALHNAILALPHPSRVLAALTRRLADTLVSTVRPLAEKDPAHLLQLASSLSVLGSSLSQVGRAEEALAVEQEAVEIHRALALLPDTYKADLAGSLTNLGLTLSQVGRLKEALLHGEEAVEIYRQLATSDPDTYAPDLASSLRNLCAISSDAGRLDVALSSGREAVEIYRRLATSDPDAHAPDLADSLTNLNATLSRAGRPEEALLHGGEAVEIYRRLATSDPDTYEPDLAGSLNNVGGSLMELKRWEEALAATEQAVEIRRRLATSDPDAHEPDLATSMSNLGVGLSGTGRREEALAATEQAVEIRRRLATTNPDAHEPDLAASLTNLGRRLSQVGRWREALEAENEAVEIYRRAVEIDMDAHGPHFVTALSNLSISLSKAGQRTGALAAAQEAAKIQLRLAQTKLDRPHHNPNLSPTLRDLDPSLSGVRTWEEALSSTEEAVNNSRRLATINPDAYSPDLATALYASARVRFNCRQDLSGALRATGEAVEIYRKLVTEMPTRFNPHLRSVLRLQADLLVSLGYVQEAEEIRRWLAANATALDS